MFLPMIFIFICGILCLYFGIRKVKNKTLKIVLIIIGLIFISFAIYIARPHTPGKYF